DLAPGSRPLSLVVQNGDVWFSQVGAGRIGRITSDGKLVEYSTAKMDSGPRALAGHPDGSVWGVLTNSNALVRIEPDGRVTEYPVPTPDSSLRGITVSARGELWFTENATNKIGRISARGDRISEYPIPLSARGARCIMAT